MPNQYQPTSIGQIAFETLSSNQEATVLGKSSRGIFIKTSGRWIVFLSLEKFRGPLTINLFPPDMVSKFDRPGHGRSHTSLLLLKRQMLNVAAKMPVQVTSGQLSIPNAGIAIAIREENSWQPPLASVYFPNGNIKEKLIILAKEAIAQENGAGFSAFLPVLLQVHTNTAFPHKSWHPNFSETDTLNLQKGIKANDVPVVAKMLDEFIGVGKGLTPSGDDFIIGLLLSLNRQKKALWPSNSLFNLNQQIIKEAYKKTTTISANLIECAAMGQADERLLATLDWLCNKDSDIYTPPFHLFEWGNSSGIAAFTGMVIAFTV